MGLAADVMRLDPKVTPARTAGPDVILSVRSGGTFTPRRDTFHRRVEAFCRLNRPALVAVVGLTPDGSTFDASWCDTLSEDVLEDALNLALTDRTGHRLGGGSPDHLRETSVDRFLDVLSRSEAQEQAILAVDTRGLHWFGRPELFAEGLYLFQKERGVTI